MISRAWTPVTTRLSRLFHLKPPMEKPTDNRAARAASRPEPRAAPSTPAGRDLPEKDRVSPILARALERHRPVLVRLATRLTRDPVEAEDLVQDAIERALSRPEALPEVARLRPWLITVMHNLFIDQCRRRARRPRHQPIDAERLATPPEPPARPWHQLGPAELRAALEQLDERFRVVYSMHALEGRSYSEIAEALGLGTSTVGTRLLRARQKLKAILASHIEGAAS